MVAALAGRLAADQLGCIVSIAIYYAGKKIKIDSVYLDKVNIVAQPPHQ